jgi:hypothetical protein
LVRFDDSKIEEIKSRVDIVELASEYLTLKRQAEIIWGCVLFIRKKRLHLPSTARSRYFTVLAVVKAAMSLPC